MREAKVDSHWLHKGRVVLKFSQVDSIADAEKLRGFDVVIPREERMPLEGDAVYVSDLLGVRVIDVSRGEARMQVRSRMWSPKEPVRHCWWCAARPATNCLSLLSAPT